MQKLFTTLNVVDFTDTMFLNATVEVDNVIKSLIDKNKCFETAYMSNFGKYVCSSLGSCVEKGITNPFKINAVAVRNISTLIDKFCKEKEKSFNGWVIRDCQDGLFCLEFATLDENYEIYDCYLVTFTPDFRYFDAPDFNESDKTLLKGSIYAVLKSLCNNCRLPIDLFEVCLTSKKSSNEGYDLFGLHDSVMECVGTPTNTKYIMGGISLICEENKFTGLEELYGKYAMIFAQ